MADGLILDVRIRFPKSLAADLIKWFNRQRREEFLRILSGVKAWRMSKTWRERQKSWAPLSEEYLRWKISQGFYRQIWKKTGAAFEALTDGAQPPTRAVVPAEPTVRSDVIRHKGSTSTLQWVIPDELEYVHFVHGGTNKMPARPWIEVDEEDAEPMQKAIDGWVRRSNKDLGKFLKAGIRVFEIKTRIE